MPFQYAIDHGSRIAYVTAYGRIDFWTSIRASHELTTAIGFATDYRVLADLRNVEYVPSPDEALDIAANLQRYAEYFRERVAVVLPSHALPVVSRLAEISREAKGVALSLFTDPEEARTFIDPR